ncbi:DotU family type IV/VI secretion system protein [Achromobacter arsenitoxydans]|uniref:Type IV / VI secretion system DotU domain-containing protein n=1 Tax=Achromobacter arsenitoxydans SY8 TaxID=477184 RepID=H0F1Y4_9BURK|nr:DotU family type IV/VI secretion system protein [Achromobacter arsenitoxydans]EHK67710.1 hypothetical protein KYC_03852 [Achromobacter arsenitoxydans SY8]
MSASAMTETASDVLAYTRLLDDTLLHLAVLEHSSELGPIHAWRARCVALLSAFDDGVRELALTAPEVRQLRLSHALLLDDATLSAIPAALAGEWAAASLCRVELGEPDAGKVVLEDMDALAAEPAATAAWLHWYASLLTAGLFRRSAETGARKRKLIDQLWSLWPARFEGAGKS